MMKWQLLCMGIALLFAQQAIAQEKIITLEMKNVPIETIVNEIEKQSDYRFVYNKQIVDVNRIVSIHVKTSSIETILQKLFAETSVTYEIKKHQIVLSSEQQIVDKREKQAQPKPMTDGKVHGQLVDEDGKPIPFATVIIKGQTRGGTTTDNNGRFTLTASPNNIIVFSFVGYRTVEKSASSINGLTITMSQEDVTMEEVVVVGYGTQKKGHLTGAISTINNNDLVVSPTVSTTNALVGKLPGLIAKQEGGLPGYDQSSLDIRGFGNPLVIVDGIESDFNSIDANEIESISILKDASAAIYGARAGNGVILVTTKRGSMGKPVITYNGSFTMQMIGTMSKLVNAGQYAELENEKQVRQGVAVNQLTYSPEQIEKYYNGTDPDYPNTNWYDFLLRKIAPQQGHNISVRGGSEAIRFFVFAGYNGQESIIKEGGPTYQRLNIRTNIDAQITKNLSFSGDYSFINSDSRLSARVGGGSGATTDKTIWQDLRTTKPIYPTTLPDPTKVSYGGRETLSGGHVSTNRNLAGEDRRQTQETIIKGKLNYKFPQVKGLTAAVDIAYRSVYFKQKAFPYYPASYTYNYASDTYILKTNASQAPMRQYANDQRSVTGHVTLNYKRNFANKHSVGAMAVLEVIDNLNTNFNGSRTDFDTQSIPWLFAGGLANQQVTSSASMMGRVSWISRVTYGYKSRYLLESTLRYDASANYPKESRWGLFPSLSLGWRISEESFIRDTWFQFISNLKLRGGVSQTGNDVIRNLNNQIINYPAIGGYNLGSSYKQLYVFNTTAVAGIYATNIPNPDLTWETMRTFNVGLDLGLFNNKIYGEMDVFYRIRDGIPGVRSVSVPSTYGADLPYENLNKMDTRGFEVLLGYKGVKRGFTWNVSGNVSWSRSKWVYYDEPVYTNPDDIRTLKKTGRWTDIRYGYLSDGLFTSQEEIDALPYKYVDGSDGNKLLRPGDIKYLDYNGDGVLTTRDYVEVGKGDMPHWIIGFNIKMAYRGFDLNALFQGALGFTTIVTLNPGNASVPVESQYRLRWTEWNNRADCLIPRYGGVSYNNWASDFFYKNGNYLRLKNLAIGYTFPKRILKNHLSKLRIQISGTNLLTFSELLKYDVDPEAPSGSSTAYYPQMRTISFGISLSL